LKAPLLVMLALPAWAQNGNDGLDLTEDAPKVEEKTPEIDLTGTSPASAPAPKVERKPSEVGQEKVEPIDITQDDRVKSVQRKLYTKRGRFELAPSFGINVNDPYYNKIAGTLRAAFYPSDALAVALRLSLIQTIKTDDARAAQRVLFSNIFASIPYWSALVDVEWSPIYGKVSIFNSILQFDGFLIGGAGIVFTETSNAVATATTAAGTVKPAADLGFGFRFIVKDWLAVNLGLVNTTYLDTPVGTTKGIVQNMMMLNVGLSMFFPLKSTYREAE
jgi:outer membrane beta-barrel protein